MFGINNLKIAHKLTLSFILIGILPLLCAIIIVSLDVSANLRKDIFEDLKGHTVAKISHLQDWAREYEKSVTFIANSERLATRLGILDKFKAEAPPDGLFPVDTDAYKQAWDVLSPKLIEIINHFKISEMILICVDHGHVMFSTAKESDLGTNLGNGEYKDTTLAKAWKIVSETKKVMSTDFEPYPPSGNQMVSFIGAPVLHPDGSLRAVLAVKVSAAEINTIISKKIGIKEGEVVFLVGKSGDRISLRSDLNLGGEGLKGIGYEYKTDYIEKALAGISGQEIFTNSNGKKQWVYYQPVSVLGFNWACISMIDEDIAYAPITKLRYLLLGVLVVIGVIIVIISRTAGKNISAPIQKIKNVSLEMGEGNLTSRVDYQSKDELGELSHAVNQSIDHLSGLVQTVISSSLEMSGTADELAGGSNVLSERTSQESTSLAESATTIGRFSKGIMQAKMDASALSAAVGAFGVLIRSNQELIAEVDATMQDIDDSGKRIDAIINVINDISSRTNLLALNAAVEAARAGEAGRGFAVVAAEVRNLAQKTAESSKNIREIISHNVQSTQKGMELVQKTAESYKKIVIQMQDLTNKIDRILDASNEHASGITQINSSLTQLKDVVTRNAELSVELAASSETLKVSAGDLQTQVRKFKIKSN